MISSKSVHPPTPLIDEHVDRVPTYLHSTFKREISGFLLLMLYFWATFYVNVMERNKTPYACIY